ncbi:MAG: DUF4124 domain-containing protein [Gammaproteobacteria bacterium]
MLKTKLMLAAVLALPLAANAGVFKCVEEGAVTYSDLPCDYQNSKDTGDPKKPVPEDNTTIAVQTNAD